MSIRRTLSIGGQALVVVAVGSLVVGSLLGQPLLLGYVTSGSMQPTLDTGDGFVAIPEAVAGEIEEGDVITFRAEELQGGGLTTHRVVGRTDEGYITKGDANPFTDQENDEPPVKRAQVVAVALQANGQVVVIPALGTLITGTQNVLTTVQRSIARLLGTSFLLGTQGLAYLVFVLSVIGYGIAAWREKDTRERKRDRTRQTGTNTRVIVAAFALLVVLGATASMVVPAGTQQYDVVSSEFDSPGPGVIPTGESETTAYPVTNAGLVPVTVFLEPASGGVGVTPQEFYLGQNQTANATVTLQAPSETGYYRRYIVEHRYFAIVPQSHLRSLYHIHPWLPILVIDALIAVPFYLLGVRLVGTGRIRTRDREIPTSISVRRAFRRLYR